MLVVVPSANGVEVLVTSCRVMVEVLYIIAVAAGVH